VSSFDSYDSDSGRLAKEGDINWLEDEAHDPASAGAESEGIDWIEVNQPPSEPFNGQVVDCWRCGKAVDVAELACPHCHARLSVVAPALDDPGIRRHAQRGESEAVTRLIYFCLALFGLSVILGWLTHFTQLDNGAAEGEEVRKQLTLMTIVDVVDAVIVLAAIFAVGRPPALPSIHTGRRVATWLALLPAFAALVAANFAYHHWLKDILRIPQIEDVFTKDKDLMPWVLLTICIQPAIFEELFFRYLALGHFRHVVGDQGAVWLSAAMFGLFHIFNPIGMPYLILAGAFFGYARLYGRSMALPMIFHFAHNAIVLWFNPWP
jgi:membrane protease YdiL (CAAX protease family)